MSGAIGSSSISFSGIVAAYNNVNSTNLSTTNISMSGFRSKSFSDGTSVPASGAISINSHFKGKTWGSPGISSGWKDPSGGSTSSNGSYEANVSNLWYKRSIIKFNYSGSLMQTKTGGSSGTIKKLRYYVSNAITNSSSYQPYPSYKISMKNGGTVSSNPGNSGWTTVWGPASHYNTSTGWKEFDITDFNWTGGTLSFAFSWGAVPRYTADGQNYVFSDSGDAYLWTSWTDASGTYTESSSASTSRNSIVPRIEMYF